MDSTLLSSTTGLCGTCKRALPAELRRHADVVMLHKHCEEHGAQQVVISEDATWYLQTLNWKATCVPPSLPRPVAQGCPFDCGPCTSHEQRVHLPIVPITSACNLDCPICYTHNRTNGAWHMSEDTLRAILRHLRKDGDGGDIINLTGGEPTQHPHFEALLDLCHAEGIRRITVSTHGLRFLKDEVLLDKLAALDARVILSFDSFREDVNRDMLGGALAASKMRVLDLLERHGVNTTLLMVVGKGLNDDELGAMVELALSRCHVRSLELHTMTFTGQGGGTFDQQARMTPDSVLRALEQQTRGVLKVADFVPSPLAHPLCYQVTYLMQLAGSGAWLPFPRFMRPEDLREMLASTLYLQPNVTTENVLTDVVNRLWTGEHQGEHSVDVLKTMRAWMLDVFAPTLSENERLRRAERSTKAVYLHTHMDEHTFDVDRIRQCPVGIQEADGRNVPSCSYNVLYRERDVRFMEETRPALVTLGRGRDAPVR